MTQMLRIKAPRRRWETRCVPGWDSRSPKEIRALQNECLHRFINQNVYAFHPYYRRLFDENKIDPDSIRTVDDLKRIPFTYKEDIAPSAQDPDNPHAFVPAPVFDRAETNGSKRRMPQVNKGTEGSPSAAEQEFREEYQPVITMFTTGATAERLSSTTGVKTARVLDLRPQ